MKGHISPKIIILLFVFLLSGIFFISLSQRFLYPSRAGETQARIFFEVSSLSARVGDRIEANIFMSVPQERMIKKSNMILNYPSENLELLVDDLQDPSTVCDNNGYYLRTLSIVSHDMTQGTFILDRQVDSVQSVSHRPLFCWGTVRFKVKKASPETLYISLDKSSPNWSISGALEEFKPSFQENTSLEVNVQ